MIDCQQITQVLQLAEDAGEVAIRYFNQTNQVRAKLDKTPVTDADIAVSHLLERELQKIKSIPVLSEEGLEKNAEHIKWNEYWLIDPIDGTKEFIKGSDEFCICIALIKQNRSIFGLIYSPVLEISWFASQGNGVFEKVKGYPPKKSIPNTNKNKNITFIFGHKNIGTRSKLMLDGFCYQLEKKGSALKFIDIIDQKADIHIKLGSTCEWDTAAAQIILEESGGWILDFTGKPIRYGNKVSLINPPFVSGRQGTRKYFSKIQDNYHKS